MSPVPSNDLYASLANIQAPATPRADSGFSPRASSAAAQVLHVLRLQGGERSWGQEPGPKLPGPGLGGLGIEVLGEDAREAVPFPTGQLPGRLRRCLIGFARCRRTAASSGLPASPAPERP